MGNQIRSHLNVNKKFKKIFGIFIELAQNIMYYSDEREITETSDTGIGIVIFTETDEFYTVTSGNLVYTYKIEQLQEKIEFLKSLSNEDLKELYNDKIRSERKIGSKGAGLGFIEISRKSENNIDYVFRPFDETYSFFNYVVKIPKA